MNSTAQRAARLGESPVFRIIAIALVYFFAHEVAFFFPDSRQVIMLVWPAGGVGLAAFLLNPRRWWPALALALFAAGIAADVWLGERSVLTAVGYMSANILESLICAWLILRRAWRMGRFQTIREAWALVVGAVGVNAATACLGAATSVLTRDVTFAASWEAWYIADGLSLLVMGPFVVVWLGERPALSGLSWRAVAEGAAFVGAWLLAVLTIFGAIALPFGLHVHPYMLVALFMWPALRLGMRGVSLATVLLLVVAVASPAMLHGPAPWGGRATSIEQRLLELQLYVGFLSIAGIFMAASYADRMRAIRRMRESRERFRVLIESAPDAIFVQREGRFAYLNPKMLKLLGASLPRQLLGTDAMARVPPEYHASIRERIRLQVETGKPVPPMDMEYLRLDGSRVYVETTAVPVRYNGRPSHLVFVRDITERKRAEAAARDGEQRFHALFANMVEGVALHETVYDEQGTPTNYRVLDVNPRFEAILGFKRELAVGRLATEIYQTPEAPYLKQFAAVGETGVPHAFETYFPPLQKHFAISVAPLGPGRWATIFSDITGQKRMEEQLRHSQKMEAVGKLAGGVAHDFNNMLTATMMNLSHLLEKPGLDAEIRESLKELESNAIRAANLTRQLLMFSRRAVMDVRVVDLNETVAGLLQMLGRLLGEPVTLVFERCSSPTQIEADAGMIEQVLMNLTVNARDAMPGGGRITLATAVIDVSADAALAHPGQRPGRYVRLSVADTGCGMDEATRKRIFEPFFTTKGPGSGTGLGLATVDGIVAQHKGWIDVDSVPGKGSRFEVFLPLTTKSLPESVQTVSNDLTGGHETILLVEDEETVREMTARVLRQLGYQVLEAGNGHDGLRVWQEHAARIDLLLTDMVMPGGMSGLDLADRLRESTPALKVIVSSGYSEDMFAQGLATTKQVAMLQKPYPLRDLAKTIRQCLD